MWEKITIKTTSGEGVENVIAILLENGIIGLEIIDGAQRVRDLKSVVSTWDYADENLLISDGSAYVVFYVDKNDDNEKKLSKIESDLNQLGKVKILREDMDEIWLDEWKKHFKPIKIGDVVIVPVWEEYEACDNETVFIIDPGTAFGTGQHESTKLCVMALQEFVKKNDLVLDIGCGSGILSCISSLIGARRVVACDIDAIGAINSTKRNAELNGIANIEAHAGDAMIDLTQKLSEEKYDVIVANIVADVITQLTPFVKKILGPAGKFITSGIIRDSAEEVKKMFEHEGMVIIWEQEINDWFAFVVKNA